MCVCVFQVAKVPEERDGDRWGGGLKTINKKTGVGSSLSELLIQTSCHLGEGKSGYAVLLS